MNKVIAVDFDGTIVDQEFPLIGEEIPGATQTLKTLQDKGFIICIWTCRENNYLLSAIEWLKQRDFTPDYINAAPPYSDKLGDSRKIYADFYFDDKSFPPFPGWFEVQEMFIDKSMGDYV